MFQLVERPAQFPGRPLLETVDGPFVDTGIEMPVGGRVYVDKVSGDEITRLFGGMSKDEALIMRARLETATAELADVTKELEKLRPLVEALREALPA